MEIANSYLNDFILFKQQRSTLALAGEKNKKVQ